MKQKLLTIMLMLFAMHTAGRAQEISSVQTIEQTDTTNAVKKKVAEEEIFTNVEKNPEFPGGAKELFKFLSKNIKYPKDCKKKGIQGNVVVQFVVDTDGSITDVTIIKKVHPSLDEEAIRVAKAMPKWIPGMNNGKNVKVKFILPINFRF